MKCEECRMLSEEYVADEQGAEARGTIAAHLDACAACREFYEEERREREVYSRYLLAVQPRADMWDALDAQIEQEFSTPRVVAFRHRAAKMFGETQTSFALPAAAMILLMFGGLMIVTLKARRDGALRSPVSAHVVKTASEEPDERSPEVSTVQGAFDQAAAKRTAAEASRTRAVVVSAVDEPRVERTRVRGAATRIAKKIEVAAVATPTEIVEAAENQHLAAIALLTRDIEARQAESTATEGIAHHADTLKTIDKVIDDTRRAVRRDPNDPTAVQHLLAAYDKKIDVLEELANRED